MPDDALSHPERLLHGMRHSRRFEDRPVPTAVVAEMLTAGHAIGDVRLSVIDDLVTMQDLTAIASLAQSMTGAAVMIVVLRTTPDAAEDASIGSRVSDAVMLTAHRHGLGGGYGWFGARDAQEAARNILGVSPPARVLLAIGVGYIDDNPAPTGSSLTRVQATLDALSGNRERRAGGENS